ncbi:fumarylacetoacetase [Roseomonas sp. NAR14]|uniref:fumarylacetoacetase n=1 Tax=Roseomonas acroporae TaxID=2937791 RepID=A0A9X2BTB3_9PROT|nr:fumarylacetoacetase [Roseomonas acroporae]MCK8784092.1 fumarylacetoacetase [Roseomonas acroporae]
MPAPVNAHMLALMETSPATPDATHDPRLRSWLPAANAAGCDFPIQNLPLGAFSRPGESATRIGVAIGDRVLDLRAARDAGLLHGPAADAATAPDLRPLMALGRPAATQLRAAVSALLREGAPRAEAAAAATLPMRDATMRLPCAIMNFTDFMISRDHTARLGARRDAANPLPPAFEHLPVAYHSRASSVRVSGEPVVRPHGQRRDADGGVSFGPCRNLDFELELAIWLAGENALGTPVPMASAPSRLFGYGLLNDWSARDIQFLEMAPLGPFLGKSLSTTVSPWIVTADAMLPFAAPAAPRPAGDLPVPPHLDSPANRESGALRIAMEVLLLTPALREAGAAPARLTATEFAGLYWTPAQLVAHHASNGCNLLPGDLLGSGTCSGPTDDSRACLAEILLGGPVTLPNGETRRFLEDGDEVIFRAKAHAPGAVPIGFGECRAAVAPAVEWPGA